MFATNGLYGHMQKNALKSALLLLGFVFLIILFWLSWCVIYSAVVDHWFAGVRRSKYDRVPVITFWKVLESGSVRALDYWWMPLFLSSCWFVVAFMCHADMIRAATGSRPVTRRENPRLYNIVEKVSIAAGLPMPRVEIMRTGALNAYAAGLTPEDSVVAVTHGLLQRLDDAELEAVVAHEMTHIKNRDVRLMVIATVFAGGLTLVGAGIANMASSGSGASVAGGAAEGVFSVSSDGDGEGGGFAVLASIVIAILFLCMAHLFAILIHFAISRSREYLADAGAVELTKNADAMISALQKISHGEEEVPGLNPNLRAMMISSSADALLSTHPSIDQRISALEVHAGGRSSVRSQRSPAVSAPQAARGPWGNAAPAGSAAMAPRGAVGFGRRTARLTPLR